MNNSNIAIVNIVEGVDIVNIIRDVNTVNIVNNNFNNKVNSFTIWKVSTGSAV